MRAQSAQSADGGEGPFRAVIEPSRGGVGRGVRRHAQRLMAVRALEAGPLEQATRIGYRANGPSMDAWQMEGSCEAATCGWIAPNPRCPHDSCAHVHACWHGGESAGRSRPPIRPESHLSHTEPTDGPGEWGLHPSKKTERGEVGPAVPVEPQTLWMCGVHQPGGELRSGETSTGRSQ